MRLIWKRDRLQEWKAFIGLQVGKGPFRVQRRLERLVREGDSNWGKRAAQPRAWASCGPRTDPGVRLIRASSQAHLGQSGLEWGNFLGGWKLNGGRGARHRLSRARGTGHTAGAWRVRETGAWGRRGGRPPIPAGVAAAKAELRARDGAPRSGTHALALTLTIDRPVRGREKLPGSVTAGRWGRGPAGDTSRPSPADGRAALPVSGRAGPPQPWCFHHAREGKEGRADGGSGRGGGGGSGQRRGPGGRAAGRLP